MKRLFNGRFGKLIAGFVLFAVTLVGIGAIGAALIGGDRVVKQYNGPGTPGFDHVTFNSFTNVPNVGDERNFFHGKITPAPDGFYDPMNGVRGGDEILMRVYVHNNADPKYNANGSGIARNTRVRVTLPTGMAQSQTAHAFISADNAVPTTIEDTLSITGEYPVQLQYVAGSATIKTNFQDKPISDNVVKGGVLIGDDNLTGSLRGCFEYVALVTFKVKIVAPSYSLDKKVRLNGTPTFTEDVTAKAGQKVDFALGFKNVGSTNLNNVVIGDKLPEGLTYVPGTTEFNSGHTGNKWVKSPSDNIVKGGVDIGAYAPGGAGYVKFTAVVTDESKLKCDMNTLTNTGYAKPKDHGTIEDKANVKVNRECKPDKPVYSCDVLDVKSFEGRKITATLKYTAKNGATFKNATYNFGDGSQPLVTDKTNVNYTYKQDGTYTVSAKVTFSVDGKNQTVGGDACEKTVTFKADKPVPPVTPPTTTTLPNTGAGSTIGLFAGVSALAAGAHYVLSARRANREQ